MLVAVADNGEDSSNGACAFSASGTAAATDAGLSLATTTLDAHPSSEFATSAASSAGEPERTDVADIGWRLHAEGGGRWVQIADKSIGRGAHQNGQRNDQRDRCAVRDPPPQAITPLP